MSGTPQTLLSLPAPDTSYPASFLTSLLGIVSDNKEVGSRDKEDSCLGVCVSCLTPTSGPVDIPAKLGTDQGLLETCWLLFLVAIGFG